MLSRFGPLIAAIAVGIAIAIQGPINSELSRYIGQFRAVFISVAVSTATVAVILLVHPGPGSFAGLRYAPPWSFLGGFMGVVALAGTIVAVPRIGVAATTGAIVAGQLIAAALIDSVGVLGVTQRPLTPGRLVGLVLLVVAVSLVTRG